MRGMLNLMRREAMQAMAERATTRIGTVLSYDPVNYLAKVRIEPDGNLTGWIPVLSPWVGNGWGMFCPPSVGDQVEVQFQEDDHNAAFACGRFYTDAARPLEVESGEFWLVHQSGSVLKFHNDGSVDLESSADMNVTVGGDLNAEVAGNLNTTVAGNADFDVAGNITSSAVLWTHTGPLVVNGSITGTAGMLISGTYPASAFSTKFSGAMTCDGVTISATGQMTFNGKRIDDTLRVSGVQPGGGNSGTPI